MVAVEMLVLRQREAGASASAEAWPILAVVVAPPKSPDPEAAALFDLLDGRPGTDRVATVAGYSRWSVLDERHGLLALSVHAHTPVRFEVDIVLPARPVLGLYDMLTNGAIVALTTPRQAARIHGQVDMRAALSTLVLVTGTLSTEFAELGDSGGHREPS